MIWTDAVLSTMLSNLIETGNILDPAAVFVGASPAIDNQGADTVIGDVTEAPGDVGDRVAVTTWTGPYKMQDGRWVVDSPVITFTPASDADATIISWVFLASLITAGVLKGFVQLPNPVPLPNEFTTLSVVVRITIDPNGRWSANVVWNG